MTDIDIKRTYVNDLYPGPGWKRRVKKMPDEQVIAIYMREQQKEADRAEADQKKEDQGDIPF